MFFNSLGVLFLFFHLGVLFFIFSRKLHTVDLLWGPAHFIFISSGYYQAQKNVILDEKSILLLLVFLWSFRLFLYLFIRNYNKPDDRRYLEIASSWKGNFILNGYLRVFIIQFILSVLTSLSGYLAVTNQGIGLSIRSIFYAGVFLSLFGLIYETIADLQLYFFKRRFPGKRLISSGLFKYSKHPNYFGEICFWWGIFLISVNNSSTLYGAISPLLITFLILKVSGVPFHQNRIHDSENKSDLKKNLIIPSFKN